MTTFTQSTSSTIDAFVPGVDTLAMGPNGNKLRFLLWGSDGSGLWIHHPSGDTYINNLTYGQLLTGSLTFSDGSLFLIGSTGADTLVGGDGNDYLDGKSGNNSLSGGGGRDYLLGGDGNETLLGGNDNDELTPFAGSDHIDGGNGYDSVQYGYTTSGITASLATGVVTGGDNDTLAGIESIYGTLFNDNLSGDANRNTLSGQGGNDTLTGGAEQDSFSLSWSGSITTITDFQAGLGGDWLPIQTYHFSNYTSGSNPFASGHMRLTQSGSDTLLEQDVDGSSGASAFQTVAILNNVVKTELVAINLVGVDPNQVAVVATTDSDTLTGTTGNDNIDGLAGDDTVSGLEGDDQLYGGLGNDVINGDVGNDHLYGDEGDDSVTGGEGSDYLYGDAGNDTLDGSAGNDAVDYFYSTSPVTVNLALGTGSGAAIGTDTLIGCEYVIGSHYEDFLIGDAGSNYFAGRKGNDTMTGGGGFDSYGLRGSSDDLSIDTVTDFTAGTAAGSDYLYVSTFNMTNIASDANPFATGHARLTQSGADTLLEFDLDGPTGPASFETIMILKDVMKENLVASNLGGFDPVATAASTIPTGLADSLTGTTGNDTIDGLAGNDTISGLAGDDKLYGSLGDDVIDGGAGFDYLYGGDGNDSLSCGAGSDYLYGGAGDDTLDGSAERGSAIYSDASGPVTVNLALGTASGAGVGTDTLISIDSAFGGFYADTLIGDANSNNLRGDSGNDTLSGNAGVDFLVGGAGDDRLDGGADSDRVDYWDASGSVTVNLALGTASGAGVGTDTLISIEGAFGGFYADTLIGDANPNSFNGDYGNDTLTGGAGSDTFSVRADSNDTSVETITDFATGIGGDYLYLPIWILTNYISGANPFTSGHVRLKQSGADTLIELDLDGSLVHSTFQTVAILKNVAKSTLIVDNLGFDPNAASTSTGANLVTAIQSSTGVTLNAVLQATLTARLQQMFDTGTYSALAASVAMQAFSTSLKAVVDANGGTGAFLAHVSAVVAALNGGTDVPGFGAGGASAADYLDPLEAQGAGVTLMGVQEMALVQILV